MRRALVLLLFLACRNDEAPAPADTGARPPLATKAKTIDAPPPVTPPVSSVQRDLNEIAAGRELRVLFTFNSTGYFIYRGATMGYEYELLQRFAADQKLKLVPMIVGDSRTLFERLNAGEGDIVAAQVIPGTASGVSFTTGLYETAPVVVQRKGDLPSGTKQVEKALARERAETPDPQQVRVRVKLIATPAELAGARVHLPQTSPYRSRLIELNDELTQDVDVVEVDATSDRLIQQTSEGDISYTVAAENFASLKAGEYTNLLVRPALGPPQQVAWAVRKNSPALLETLDAWIEAKKKSGLFRILYRKYFQDRQGFTRRAASRYLTSETGRLSPYDQWFREYAKIPGWDWRLVASQAYQESRFQPNARSWAGATGVMQIMPATARELRVDPRDPRQSIEGACRYLWKLDQRYQSIEPERERIKFILGAYNVGLGHVEDARRLAEKNGDDPAKWDDVAYWLIRKSKRAVYSDPVVKYGFARGTEPVAYVDVILDRYAHYRQFVKEEDVSKGREQEAEGREAAEPTQGEGKGKPNDEFRIEN